MSDTLDASPSIFQAIGLITGEVNIGNDSSTITIAGNQYPLLCMGKKVLAFNALKREIESTGVYTQSLVVYPKVLHFSKPDEAHQIAFHLVGFDKGREQETLSDELDNLEFKLSGFWQFIPVCPTPCISVFRNFTEERLEYVKQSEPAKKVKFLKPIHAPLFWKDAPVRPFRFNSKIPIQEQGKRVFVCMKARFLPGRNAFGFVALTAPPTESAPRFLKASKQDKTVAMQEAKKSNAENS